MAGRRSSPGLSIGQLVTLTFGFLVASVLIFGFGWWVGYDVAEQRLAREQQIIRLPAQTLTPLPAAAATMAPFPVGPTATPSAARGMAGATPGTLPTATRVATPAAARPTVATHVPTVSTPSSGAAAKGWTVQVIATTDAVQAAMLVHRLRGKGFDAYPVTAPIQGTMWYRVRVGHYRERAEAQATERRLKESEGLQAAFATEQ